LGGGVRAGTGGGVGTDGVTAGAVFGGLVEAGGILGGEGSCNFLKGLTITSD
jgi:hypothetical protein